MLKRLLCCTVVGLSLAACDSGTGPDGGFANVSIQFRADAASSSNSLVRADLSPSRASSAASLTLTGSNGTLTLDDVRFVVAEFELELADSEDDCDEVLNDDDCQEIELPPQFLQLPLDGAPAAPSVSQSVAAGLYGELEFEVEDLDFDDADEDEQELQQLFQTILSEFPDWPAEASLMVVGSFTPTGGTPVPFRVFFDAEIEIEIEFPAPGLDLVAAADPTVTVVVDPALWFSRPDGTVMDLSQFEGQLVEFEAELENGFTEIEFDD